MSEVSVRDEFRDEGLLEDVASQVQAQPTLVLPETGQIVDLRKPSEVADALEQVREAKRRLEELRGFLELVLRAESIRQGSKTLHLEGGLEATVSGGSRPVVDDPELLVAELEQAGLPPERIAEAIRQVVSWDVRHGILSRIATASERYAEVIERHRRREPAAWSVSVKRERGSHE